MTREDRRRAMPPSDHPDDAQLQLVAEGLVEGEELARIERHLEDCPTCRAAVAGYGSLFEQLNAVPVVEAPAAVADSVLAAYHRTREPIHALWSDRKLLVAFGLANVVLFLTVTTSIVVHGPVDLIGEWAVGLKDLLLSALELSVIVEALWTGIAHGGILAVAALALLLVTTVAALRQTLGLSEETS